MKLRVRFFASHRESAGTDALVGEFPAGTTVRTLFDILAADRKDLKALEEHTLAAVNEEQADWSRKLKNGDEVAFYPPVGGG